MNPIDKLTDLFIKFPGIGPRQARRFAYFLLARDPAFIDELSDALVILKTEMKQCRSCFRYFQNSGSDNLCAVCQNPERDATSLLVVEKDVDFENMHASGAWSGMYFILGGSVPVLEKEPAKKIRAKELFLSIQERAQKSGLREIVLATSATSQGENTTEYLFRILAPLAEKYSLTVTSLGRGISSGAEIEYSDPDTLKNAIESRR
jgi:recombination protein RecR